MKLTDLQRRWIVIGIASSFVIFGLVQVTFRFKFFNTHKMQVDQITFWLMIIAAILLFGGRKKE